MSKTSKIKTSTQQFLDINEIKDNTIILKDGSVRAVLMVSSINFALKDEEEQEAIISSYVSFLNNISFPIQIVVQSRQFNIESYLEDLEEKAKEQTNELLKMQTEEYIGYIKELVSMGNIMNKKFYIVIPYHPLSDKHENFFTSLKNVFLPANLVKLREKNFKRYREELERRVVSVTNSLRSIGLNSVKMDTQSLIELFYNTYNPETSQQEKLADLENIRVKI